MLFTLIIKTFYKADLNLHAPSPPKKVWCTFQAYTIPYIL